MQIFRHSNNTGRNFVFRKKWEQLRPSWFFDVIQERIVRKNSVAQKTCIRIFMPFFAMIKKILERFELAYAKNLAFNWKEINFKTFKKVQTLNLKANFSLQAQSAG